MSLDILRALAVALVLGRHLPRWPDNTPGPVDVTLSIWKQVGWIGVDLFFVLSGFLVSGLLFREYLKQSRVDIPRFLIRRGLKIYPAFYVMLAVLLTVKWFDSQWPPSVEIVSEALFLQSYLPRIWNHTWTLAVEEHFYLLIAFAIGWLAKRSVAASSSTNASETTGSTTTTGNPFRTIAMAYPWVAGAALIARIVTAQSGEYSHSANLIPTHLRLDSLWCGVFVAYSYHFHAERFQTWSARYRWPLMLLGVALIAPVFVFEIGESWVMHTIGFTLLQWGAAALLIAVVDWHPAVPSWVNRVGAALAYCGMYSYSIYLLHIPVQHYLSRFVKAITGMTGGYWGRMTMYMIGSVIIGIVYSKIVEYPVLRWRDRMFPSVFGGRDNLHADTAALSEINPVEARDVEGNPL